MPALCPSQAAHSEHDARRHRPVLAGRPARSLASSLGRSFQYLGPINPACVALKCDVPTPSGNLSQPCMKARCPPPFNSSNCDHATASKKLPTTACDDYCAVLHSTPVYMGGIHPRLKRPVGLRCVTRNSNSKRPA